MLTTLIGNKSAHDDTETNTYILSFTYDGLVNTVSIEATEHGIEKLVSDLNSFDRFTDVAYVNDHTYTPEDLLEELTDTFNLKS